MRQQRLRDDALETERELRAHLRLLVARKHVDDAVDRLGRAVRVQRRERQVSRLGDGQTGLNRFQIAHFADEHDVGILPQRVLERGLEALGVDADFALVDDAVLVLVNELDRILDRDHVSLQLLVDLVEHRGERRRLAGARGAGDEDQAARLVREIGDDLRQLELLEGLDVERESAG